jgi:folate-binding protein YgfZ
MRVLDGGAAGLWLDCERSALQELFNMIRRYKLGRDVEVHKRTLERALLSLIGPEAVRLAGAEGTAEGEHAHRLATVGGAQVRLVRTDMGVDVIADAEDAEAVRTALVGAGAEPADEEAAEVLRVESGRPRFGVDIEPDAVIPQEAGLNERAVSFEKGCYVGQETVARLHWRGKPNRHLRGLRLSEPVAAGSELVSAEGRVVGRVTSPVTSPELGPIALALVRREVAPGETVSVGDRGATAVVTELPLRL